LIVEPSIVARSVLPSQTYSFVHEVPFHSPTTCPPSRR
jgi:hypothetical protein